MTVSLKDREIFAIGKWSASTGPVNVTSDMLDQIVTSYDTLNSKVEGYAIPLKLGHNKRVGEPAYGYAENIRRDGDKLIADFTDVPPEIVDAINQRRYNAVSVELWPQVKFGEQVHTNVLSGVALLGAEWPAVKGLKPLSAFGDASGALMLSQEEDNTMNFTQEQHDAILAAAVAKAKDEGKAENAAALTEATTKLTAETARADTAEAALAAFADEKEKAEVAAVIEAAEKAGKIVPANKAKITAFAETIRKSVAKGDERKALVTGFKEFVEGLPAKVKFGEDGAAHEEIPGTDDVQAEINAKVDTLRKADKTMTYRDALDRVFAENPDLKTRYAEDR